MRLSMGGSPIRPNSKMLRVSKTMLLGKVNASKYCWQYIRVRYSLSDILSCILFCIIVFGFGLMECTPICVYYRLTLMITRRLQPQLEFPPCQPFSSTKTVKKSEKLSVLVLKNLRNSSPRIHLKQKKKTVLLVISS